jgi:hypothetical protein
MMLQGKLGEQYDNKQELIRPGDLKMHAPSVIFNGMGMLMHSTA